MYKRVLPPDPDNLYTITSNPTSINNPPHLSPNTTKMVQIHPLPLLTTLLLTLSPTASTYRVTLWQNPDCTGNSRELNVYDNTCANVSPGYSAITPRAYSTDRNQRAYFYGATNCGGHPAKDWWADGGSDAFIIGRCLSLDGAVGNSCGSYFHGS